MRPAGGNPERFSCPPLSASLPDSVAIQQSCLEPELTSWRAALSGSPRSETPLKNGRARTPTDGWEHSLENINSQVVCSFPRQGQLWAPPPHGIFPQKCFLSLCVIFGASHLRHMLWFHECLCKDGKWAPQTPAISSRLNQDPRHDLLEKIFVIYQLRNLVSLLKIRNIHIRG